MRTLGAFVLALGWVLPAAADPLDLQEASRRLLRGNYAEAREQFAALAKNGKYRVPAAIGLSRTWRSEGDYEKAQGALAAALKDQPTSGDLWAELADLLYLLGRWDEAQQAAQKALQDGKGQFLAHWVLARVHRDRGDLKKSSEELIWFVRAYSKEEPTDPEQLLLVGQELRRLISSL